MGDEQKSVYGHFIDEIDAMVIKSDEPAAAVVGRLTRAVRRAQLVYEGQLKSPEVRGWGETQANGQEEQSGEIGKPRSSGPPYNDEGVPM